MSVSVSVSVRILSFLILFGITTQAHAGAGELNLACFSDSDTQVRTVLVAKDKVVRTLLASSGSIKTVNLSQYAVVIDSLTNDFQTLSKSEYKLEALVGIPEESQGHQLIDKKNGVEYVCNEDIEVFPNPAVSRGD